MTHKHLTRGFTLIELLVVIAIIGILTAIVLASLNAARSKGNDAGIMSDFNTVGTQSAIYLSDNNNAYGAFDNGSNAPAACPVVGTTGTGLFYDTTVENAIAGALTDSAGGTTSCYSTDAAFAVAVSRPAEVASTTSNYWCVDSSGEHCGINDSSVLGSDTGNPSCGTCVTGQ
jgi:prepilin-type N-terminal cleavage/methylation domain-containing protein